MRNSGHRLVCVTVKPHNQSVIFFSKQVPGKTSWLDLKAIKLFALTEQQIKNELICRNLSLEGEQLKLLINCIQDQLYPYDFLEYVCNRIATGNDNSKPFKNQLASWQKQFNQQRESSVFSKLNSLRLIISYGLNSLNTTIKIVISILIVIAIFFEKVQLFFGWIFDKGLSIESFTILTRGLLAFVAAGVAIAIINYLGKSKDTNTNIGMQNLEIIESQNKYSQLDIDSFIFNEEQKSELLKLLREQLTNAASTDLIADIKTQAIATLQTETFFQDITNAHQQSYNRLYQEIDDLSRRGNINLALGVAITVIGLFILGGFLVSAGEPPQEMWSFLSHYIPRLTLILFIELFAYFFLYLYKKSLEEIKYFQNELTNLEAEYTALIAAFKQNDITSINSVITNLATTERNRILNKNQTTTELEVARIEKHSTVDVSKLLTDLVSNLSPKKD